MCTIGPMFLRPCIRPFGKAVGLWVLRVAVATLRVLAAVIVRLCGYVNP